MGPRGAPVSGCRLLLGEDITGHLRLPRVSRSIGGRPGSAPCRGNARDRDRCAPAPRVPTGFVPSPPQPSRPCSSRTHRFVCRCSAGSCESISEAFTCRQEGRMRRGRAARSLHSFVGCETRPPWHPGSLSASLSFTPLCVNDVHERALSQISRLRNTSVRPRQRRAYPVSRWVADVALSQRPGMLTWSRGGSQTQVGSSRTKEQGLLSSASLGREREEPKATYCHCCYVHFFLKKGVWWR